LQLGVAVRSGDHGAAVHVHEDWQVFARRWSPDVEVQAVF
jgi:hypothetical protein